MSELTMFFVVSGFMCVFFGMLFYSGYELHKMMKEVEADIATQKAAQ